MFRKLIDHVKSKLSNVAIGYAERVAVAIPFVLALGFTLAAVHAMLVDHFGSVTGNSTNNNKVHIGGLVGQAGGVHINCYAAGDIVSRKTTTDVGALNGRSAGIAVDYNCYFNSEALQ